MALIEDDAPPSHIHKRATARRLDSQNSIAGNDNAVLVQVARDGGFRAAVVDAYTRGILLEDVALDLL